MSLREITDEDERAWADLVLRAAEPNPLMEASCLLPAARYQPFGGELKIAFAVEADRFCGCLPIKSVGSVGGYWYPFVTTQMRRTVECETPLVDRERGVDAVISILSGLRARRRRSKSRVLALSKVSQDGPFFSVCIEAARTLGFLLIVLESGERGLSTASARAWLRALSQG